MTIASALAKLRSDRINMTEEEVAREDGQARLDASRNHLDSLQMLLFMHNQ